MTPELINNNEFITVENLIKMPHSSKVGLQEALDIIVSPDTRNRLELNAEKTALSEGGFQYPIVNGLPVLYPKSINEAFLNSGLNFEYYNNSELQYYLLSQIKQNGEINAPSESLPYQRHLYRMREFLQEYNGLSLDIGCDDIDIGAALLSKESRYIGLDPFTSESKKFKIVGVGEALPFQSGIFDVAIFNTSLDHILDYHTAIDEAYRVLKPGGILVICSLIWLNEASLLKDMVHFHHFRDYEIKGAITQKGTIIKQKNYPYKEDTHRYGMFIASKKNEY
jgi:SAM-dependent methyltransferase